MKQIVISGAKSRSHLVYLASYVRTLGNHGEEIAAYFIPLPSFLHADAVTVADVRAVFPENVVVKEGLSDWSPQAETVYLCVGAPGVRVLRTLMAAMGLKAMRLRIVIVDEGIGSYGDLRAATSARRRQGASVPAALVKSSVGSLMRRIPAKRWATLTKTDGQWLLNKDVVAEFSRYGKRAEIPNSSAVILTQPFVDMGLITEEAYLTYVRALAQAAERHDLNPVVRPHPAERPGRYEEFTVMPDVGTAELDPHVLAAAVCLGGPSTALVNVAAMHHMPVVWSSAPSLEFLDTEVSRAQQEIFHTFLGAPTSLAQVGDAIGERLER